MQSQIPPK
jgi:hypothetical protein